MEKVYDSVQQILECCDALIEATKGCEFLDVRSLNKSLGDACSELRAAFRDDPGNEVLVRTKKQVAERLAIRLETFASIRLHIYNEIVEKRKIASMVYQDCRALTLELNRRSGVDKIDLLYWATSTQWALKFYARSCHCLFVFEKEDEDKLVELVNKMKIMEDKYGNGRQVLSGGWLSERKA